MNPTTVLRKTEAGIAAIKTRDKALSPRQRTLLITVDGVKPMQALSQVCTSLQEALLIGNELEAWGFVERLPDPSPATLAPTPKRDAGQIPARAIDIRPNIRKATRALEDLLGPACEPLALQLEKCKTQEELTSKINDLRRVVASMRSEKKADEFLAAALAD